MALPENEKPLNVAQAAQFLDVTKSHLYKLTSRGVIPHYKPTGNRIYFFQEDLIQFIKKGRVKPQSEIERAASRSMA